jgi:hypothetical protein
MPDRSQLKTAAYATGSVAGDAYARRGFLRPGLSATSGHHAHAAPGWVGMRTLALPSGRPRSVSWRKVRRKSRGLQAGQELANKIPSRPFQTILRRASGFLSFLNFFRSRGRVSSRLLVEFRLAGGGAEHVVLSRMRASQRSFFIDGHAANRVFCHFKGLLQRLMASEQFPCHRRRTADGPEVTQNGLKSGLSGESRRAEPGPRAIARAGSVRFRRRGAWTRRIATRVSPAC